MSTFKLCLTGRTDKGAEEAVKLLQRLVRMMRKHGLEVDVHELGAKPEPLFRVTKCRKVNVRSAPGWTAERQKEAVAALLAFVPGRKTSSAINATTGIDRSTLIHLLRGTRMGLKRIKQIVEKLGAMQAPLELIKKFQIMLTATTQ